MEKTGPVTGDGQERDRHEWPTPGKTENLEKGSTMIGEKMQAALNEQIKHELESGYLYLSMATYFHEQNLDGMAHWMKLQEAEEREHAMKMFDHLIERGGTVELKALSEPQREWESPLDAFKAAYEHEKFVTSKIHDLVNLADEEGDLAAKAMLQWFVTEQVEEEDHASGIVNMLERVGDSGNGIMMVDRELGRRE